MRASELCIQLVKLGDIMEGHVTSKEFRELSVRVTSFVGSYKFREMVDINIHVSSLTTNSNNVCS